MNRPKKTAARQSSCATFATALAFALAFTSCETMPDEPDPGDVAGSGTPGEVAFETSVKPLFENRCVWCHSNRDTRAGLNLQDRAATLDPALRFIVPGDPGSSRIYQAITREIAHPVVMPGDGWGLTRDQTENLRLWISEGAPWPEDRAGRITRKPYRVEHDDYR